MDETMLHIRDLNSHYGLSHVIQGISLDVQKGEILGVFGRNGVGKTTLLKNIAGWVKPSSGSIQLDGKDIGGSEPDAINREGLAIVPEDRRIFPGLTVQENLELGLLGLKGPKPASKLDPVLERFPRLAERVRQPATTLSGGEQQMLAMARIMVADPRVVLIDEPSEGLAPMIVAEIFAIVREMRDAGCAIVLVEQNIHEALAVCDRFVLIERGTIVFEGDAEDEPTREKLLQKLAV
ncbi:ABC transporter ATP-binding protein [uncultured Roseovarius sp.]|nr:ABC transporter ATP-binding protein [uncultured Roseovarius sp.]